MKTILIFLIIVFSYSFAIAQKVIPLVGITKTSITFNNKNVDLSQKYNYVVGLGIELPINSRFMLFPEVSYVGKGADFEFASSKHKLNLNYIDCSFLIKRNLVNKKHKLQVYVGPSVGIGIGGEYSNYRPEKYSYDVKFTSFPKNGYDLKYFAYVDNRFELSINVGIWIEFFERVVLDVRLEQGVTRLYKTKNRGEYYNEPIIRAKNRLLQLSIGIPISF